jgi:localization factor PodJL
MRPDLPWNVAGIPPEAREAARAAARRQGLPVGEWLTRRIVRGLALAGDEDELTRDSFAASRNYRSEEPAAPYRRETDEMLDRVSRSKTESDDVWRRIEEQLKGVTRRMDNAERSQSENNRVLSKAATEMNIATREQAQAFDQLSAHVVGLAERLERVERAGQSGSMRDAVKGLHTGLSRVADQLAQNATQSAAQISALATNLEAVANRVAQSREEAESVAHLLDQRVGALDDRVYGVEKASQASAASLECAIDNLQSRLGQESAEIARRAAAASAAIESLKEREAAASEAIRKLEDRDAATAAAVARLEEHASATAGMAARLEESVERLEARAADPEFERRLLTVERSLSGLLERFEDHEPGTAKAIEDSLKKLLNRVEATEIRHRDAVSEFRSALSDAAARIAALEARPIPAPAPAPAAAPPSSFVAAPPAPPVADSPFPDAPAQSTPPFPAQDDPFLPAAAQEFDAAPPFAEDNPFESAQAFDDGAFAPSEEQGESFLSAARRSARAAADTDEPSHGFPWGQKAAPEEAGGRTRTMLLAFVTLVAIALVAGIVLSQGLFSPTQHAPAAAAMFPNKSPGAPAPQAGTPLHALSSQADEDAQHAAPPPAAPAAGTIAKPPPQPVSQSPARPARAAVQKPEPQKPHAAPRSAEIPALDRLTALANSGNARAETIVGLRYLNGEGVPVNESLAVKWLERAAQRGEPVAQYRLGTLYERGKGVAANAAKATHWYQAAAMQGNRKAMHNLAVALAEGTGIKKDLNEAARWFSKAASLGLADSQFNLAVLYERGLGVPQSLLDAYKWYAIAAASGDTESRSRIEALSTQISSDDRAAAQHAAETFRAAPLDQHANVAPQIADLPRS